MLRCAIADVAYPSLEHACAIMAILGDERNRRGYLEHAPVERFQSLPDPSQRASGSLLNSPAAC